MKSNRRAANPARHLVLLIILALIIASALVLLGRKPARVPAGQRLRYFPLGTI
jgi:hypothetical protein